MKRINTDALKEKKKKAAYAILCFFSGAFTLKAIAGVLSGSSALLFSGLFELFGVFLAGIALLRIRVAAEASQNVRSDFSLEKMEFLVAAGVALFIAVTTSLLLFSAVHVLFYHTINPPGLLAAWVATLLAGANLYALFHLKEKVSVLEEADEKRLRFLFDKDFILSVSVVVVVIISMSGLYLLDSLFSVLEAVFIIAYSIIFLLQSFKGLMDASIDLATVADISRFISRVDPSLQVRSLKVNQVGKKLVIMTTLGLPRQTLIKEAKAVMAKIDHSLRAKLPGAFDLHIGLAGK